MYDVCLSVGNFWKLVCSYYCGFWGACAGSLLPASHPASPAHSSVNYGSGGGGSGSQACTESILPTESPPQRSG